MKLLHSSQNAAIEHNFKNVLEGAGIECTLKNELRETTVGGVPPTECWVELWIVDDDRLEEAKKILDTAVQPEREPANPWTCPECGESIESQFTECWRCGKSRAGG